MTWKKLATSASENVVVSEWSKSVEFQMTAQKESAGMRMNL